MSEQLSKRENQLAALQAEHSSLAKKHDEQVLSTRMVSFTLVISSLVISTPLDPAGHLCRLDLH